MPRGKGFRRSQAAKRRMAKPYSLSPADQLADENSMVSNGSNDFPKSSNDFPKSSNDFPKSSNDFPKSSNDFPKSSNDFPKSSNDFPKSSNDLPKCSNDLPKCSKDLPKCSKDNSVHVTNFASFSDQVLKGSFHQGDERFGYNRNRQCGVNSLTAVMMSKLKNVLTWTTDDLNTVLVKGDEIYTCMRLQGKINDSTGSGYVSIAELPKMHTLYSTKFKINYNESYSGRIGDSIYDEDVKNICMPVDEAIQRALLDCDACLLNIKDNICSVIKEGTRFAIFDPHARNCKGMCEYGIGTSIVAYYDDIHMLYGHVLNLAKSLNAELKPFEVTGVNATVIEDAAVKSTLKTGKACSSTKQPHEGRREQKEHKS
ncbi:uncharacterized protein [Misgurnus anguillicaudatus]|uniref:uncharacterized protein n=1 Tax=Misgurnus anguillicaudatus TaxID=75329 RepID=UPI003CCF0614